MNNEELLKQIIEGQKQLATELKAIRTDMATKQDLSAGIDHLENKIDMLAAITQDDVVGMLTHVKATAEQIDERIENIEDDLNYLAKKSVKYGSEIGKLKKIYMKHL